MKKILFILCGLFFLSFSAKAEFAMVMGDPDSGEIWLYDTETGNVWACSYHSELKSKACIRVPIDMNDISKELQDKGFKNHVLQELVIPGAVF